MKRKTLILLCLSLCCLTAEARPRKGRAPARAKTVTVTGCVTQGVECPLLVSFDGARKYSLSHDRRLKAGRAYRVTGTIQEMSTCMEGTHLSPRKVTQLRTHCPAR